MKPIKLLFIISLILFASNIKSQTFIDSSVYYTLTTMPNLSAPDPGFESYIKEVVVLDSNTQNGAFYTVNYNCENREGKFNFKYQLKNKGNKVYLTGKLDKYINDSFDVSDLLVYDFNLKKGDTLKINNTDLELNLELLIDSIVNVLYFDGISRETFYYNVLTGGNFQQYSNILYASKGMGSNYGLLPFKLINIKTPYYQRLISVCDNNKNTVYVDTLMFGFYGVKNFCDEKEISDLIDIMRGVSINEVNFQSVKVYPNPSTSKIYVDGLEDGEYKIYNSTGQLQLSGNFENFIQIESIKTGLYFIFIEQNDFILRGSFIKE